MNGPAKSFSIVSVQSVVLRRFLTGSPESVVSLLEHMTSQQLTEHQLPGAAEVCREELLRQFHWAITYSMPTEGFENVQKLERWISWIERHVGHPSVVVSKLPATPLVRLSSPDGLDLWRKKFFAPVVRRVASAT